MKVYFGGASQFRCEVEIVPGESMPSEVQEAVDSYGMALNRMMTRMNDALIAFHAETGSYGEVSGIHYFCDVGGTFGEKLKKHVEGMARFGAEEIRCFEYVNVETEPEDYMEAFNRALTGLAVSCQNKEPMNVSDAVRRKAFEAIYGSGEATGN